jgi:hypothetical protein
MRRPAKGRRIPEPGQGGQASGLLAAVFLDLQFNGLGTLAMSIRLGFEGNALVAHEGCQAGSFHGGDMNEDVRIAIVRHDEAESLVRLEELHDASLTWAALDRRTSRSAALATTETVAAATAITTAETVTAAAAITTAETVATAAAITAAETVATAGAITAAEAAATASAITTAEAAATTGAITTAEATTAATAITAAETAAAAAETITAAAEAVATAAGAFTAAATKAVATAKTITGRETAGLFARGTPARLAEAVPPPAALGLVALVVVVTTAEFFRIAAKVLRTTAPSALPTVVRTPVIHVKFTLYEPAAPPGSLVNVLATSGMIVILPGHALFTPRLSGDVAPVARAVTKGSRPKGFRDKGAGVLGVQASGDPQWALPPASPAA